MKTWQCVESRGKLFKRAVLKSAILGVAALTTIAFAGPSSAQSLLDKIKNGETIRLGFSNEPPFANPGKNNEPLGWVNAMALDILKMLGSAKVEPVVTEWGSLIPGMHADRFDIITGGMYILPDRCKNVLFTEPVGVLSAALIVPKGNPENLRSYKDLREKGLVVVTGAGWDDVVNARNAGIAEDHILQVAGSAEVLQAVKAGRAAAGVGDYFTLKEFAEKDASVDVTDPLPDTPKGYPAFAFLSNQQAAVDAFNAALKDYLGSDQMMKSVGEYGYAKVNLPDGTTAAQLCKG
ncbi:ectoine/hydroxyectoine ABC transporter substrate-binding protein EhuB [Mesorhizobium sp.]|uniref:ectoine/hydroxyectoine ABC transporter substrate-binding protein EhuB n=1 Tax=Mesorhizobium sp. TaxID=1871066 RepID=UPI000FE8F3C3|nr:ectoine/hydroxyectoine ABC transporter substrate-binding protein EhuB [Mesorhizobium sp.]RWF89768.1 MAG: ectoine/hydroxyectoine ABC transporter substrate-binding protein EhuB [Mesorhizobium sp.]RWJ56960.1 MAG: ectoine/hydroxyectoine ABC transporter substrate-binding protein EhuB [Mesorhizobium sp.]RWJ63156.1 MAG: ectoine/hydroxyectoine ABC transporter substrate-binding protein EhuB [Mesorhizobium sp.]RWJ92578.1 MAG: ectoine/hydroxyectoine ABC transporter substrate-binding protein EhuB [Mesor